MSIKPLIGLFVILAATYGCALTSNSELAGSWYLEGDVNKRTEIMDTASGLEARNENGVTSRLEVNRSGTIRALDWGDLRGDYNNDRIQWSNGSAWVRDSRTSSVSDRRFEGTWYLNGDGSKRTAIVAAAGRLEAHNETGGTSRLEVDRSGSVRALDWGLRGDLRNDQIQWSNGSVWTRASR